MAKLNSCASLQFLLENTKNVVEVLQENSENERC